MNTYLKQVILCFGVLLVTFGCKNDDDLTISNRHLGKTNLKVKTIQNSEIMNNTKLQSKLQKISNFKTTTLDMQHREVYNELYDFYIETDVANYIESEKGHSYTFPVYRDMFTGLTENLLLALQDDDSYQAFLITYNFTDSQKDQIENKNAIVGNYETSITVLDEDLSDTILNKMIYEDGCYINRRIFHVNQDGTYLYEGTCPHEAAGDFDYCASYTFDTVITCHDNGTGTSAGGEGGPSGNYNTQSGGTPSNGGGSYQNNNTSPILCTRCPEAPCPEPSVDILAELDSVFGSGNYEFDCDLEPDETLNFDTVQDLENYLNALLNSDFIIDSSTLESGSLREDIYSVRFSDFPIVDIVTISKIMVPEPNNDLECLEIINAYSEIEGNETFHQWEQLSNPDPSQPGGVIVIKNEEYDFVRVYIRGKMKLGLRIGGYPLRGTKLISVMLDYNYSTSVLNTNSSTWLYTN